MRLMHSRKASFAPRLRLNPMASLVPVVGRASTRFRLKPHPLVRDLFLTAGAEIGVLLGGLLVISVFRRLLGAIALAQYLLLRRVLAWLQSGAQLGVGVALPRQVAHAIEESERHRSAYFVAGLSLVLGFAVCTTLVLRVDSRFFARLLFGAPEAAELLLPLALLLFGLGAHVAVYSYYRGVLAMARANALQLWNLAIVPVGTVVALHRTGSVALVVSVMGILNFVSSLTIAFPVVVNSLRLRLEGIVPRGAALLGYGVTRVPADFGISALFAVGPMVASHYVGMQDVASLLLGLSILTAVSV